MTEQFDQHNRLTKLGNGLAPLNPAAEVMAILVLEQLNSGEIQIAEADARLTNISISNGQALAIGSLLADEIVSWR